MRRKEGWWEWAEGIAAVCQRKTDRTGWWVARFNAQPCHEIMGKPCTSQSLSSLISKMGVQILPTRLVGRFSWEKAVCKL